MFLLCAKYECSAVLGESTVSVFMVADSLQVTQNQSPLRWGRNSQRRPRNTRPLYGAKRREPQLINEVHKNLKMYTLSYVSGVV
jgi:hypothetical protein